MTSLKAQAFFFGFLGTTQRFLVVFSVDAISFLPPEAAQQMGGGDQASPSASDLHHFLFRSQGGSSFDLQVLPWKILGGIRWKFRKSRNWGFE